MGSRNGGADAERAVAAVRRSLRVLYQKPVSHDEGRLEHEERPLVRDYFQPHSGAESYYDRAIVPRLVLLSRFS